MKNILLFLGIALLITLSFFKPLVVDDKLPIPADTIVGLYYPFRDLYAKEYPRGIPFKNFQITDPVRQQYPWKSLTIEQEKKSVLPLWNPYNFSGTPLLANFQSAAFYPLNIFFFVLPFSFAWSLLIFSQPFFSLIFMFLFLRNLRLGIGSSAFGAISFAFCGFFVSWMEWGNVVSTGMWLPLILLSIDKIFRNAKWFIVLLLSLTCSFLAGHLQVFFYMFVVSCFYFFGRWWQYGKSKKLFGFLVLVIVLFLLVTAVQWLPTFQFISESARNLDQDWHNPGWFVPWQNLTQLIAPDFFGNPATLNYWGVWNYGEFISYIGLLAFLFALYAGIFTKRKIVWFFSAIVLISFLFALPTIIAKIPFKFALPFLSTSQPTRLLFLADFSLSILAAFGLELFLQSKKKIFVPILLVGFVIVLFWGFVFLNQQLPTALHITSNNLAVTKNNLKLPTLFYFISLILIGFYLFFSSKIKHGKIIFIVAVLVITILDLYRFSGKYLAFAEQKYLFPDTKILSYLKQQKGEFRVTSSDSRIFPPNFSIMYHIQTPDGYDPLYLQRYAEFSAAISRGQPNINPPFGFNRIITIQTQNDFINLLNVKYLVVFGEIQNDRFKKVLTEGDTTLYENTDVMPRAFFVQDIVKAVNKQDAINKLFDIRNKLSMNAVVEGFDENMSLVNILPSDVMVERYEANAIILRTNTVGNKFLVFTDSYYPTWHARVCADDGSDCHETKIYLTDFNFRGIVVPGGKHHIEFYNSLL